MTRKERINLVGFYHIINRGVEKREIFSERKDFYKFLEIIDEYAKIFDFEISSFCLMNNHYHLLLKTNRENLSQIMKHINLKYAVYFNKKQKRVGHLWQGRFKSWYVYDASYLTSLIKYIEFNPIESGIGKKIGEYSYAMSTKLVKLNCLNYELIDKMDFKEITEKDTENINKIYDTRLKIDEKKATKAEKKELSYFFKNYNKEAGIIEALKEGYNQAEIAEFLHLSIPSISKIKKIFNKKEKIFNDLKEKGIFWSFDKKIQYKDFHENVFIEYVLKYGDFWDIKDVFDLFGKRKVKKVWEKKVKKDKRFIKLNLLVARVFLDLDIEIRDLKSINEFRKFAS